jgi:tetratricopeptide (TPR) repeat protein
MELRGRTGAHMNRHERRAAAKSAKATSTPSAITPESLCKLGFALLEAGQTAEAENCSREALKRQPTFADAFQLTGLIAISRGQYDRAVEWFSDAIRQTPKPEYYHGLGNALELLERLDEALTAYDRAVSLKPEDAELYNNMGVALTKLHRDDEAVHVFQHVLKLSPRHKQATNMCATLLFKAKRHNEAIDYFNLCAELEPDSARIYQDRGTCHSRLLQFDEARSDYERALQIDPGNAATHYNLGHAHLKCDRFDAASRCFERALALDPDLVPCLINKGLAAIEQRQFAEAIACYNRALAIEPQDAVAQFNLSDFNLLTGDFAAGWAGREARCRAKVGIIDRKFVPPPWLGKEPIAGKTILLHASEGIGDAIQFSRYAPMVAARGARVILEVHQPVQALLSGIPGVSQCLSRGRPLPEFDCHCALESLPFAFQTDIDTIPAPIFYSAPETLRQQWESWLGPHNRLRVGLVWSGSTGHKNDHKRSTTLQTLLPILELDATFVSLQKEPRDQDQIVLRQCADVMDAGDLLTDFVATAGLISCLDLVITVDTSVAHLAGALGRPVWILLPFTPDFRWLLDRDDSPWYPTARLFRQNASREWPSVIERVRTELGETVARWIPKEEEPVPAD